MSRVPQMAKQLEVSLYRNAPSFDAYMDMSTLKKRLQMIAAEVQRKTRGQADSSRASAVGASDDRRYDRQPQSQPPQQAPPPPQPQQPQPQHPPYQSNGVRDSRGNAGYPPQPQSRMMNMSDANPVANNQAIRQPGNDANFGRRTPLINDPMTRGSAPQQQSSGVSTSSSFHNRNDPEWKMRIRHKQQRLLLLHHSAKCPHEDGRCSVTPHCADMKRLWRHMEGCKDNNCRVPHCFSSRAILSHYRKCKDPTCPACGPVRETVRRSKGGGYRSASSSIQPMVPRGPPQQQQPPPQAAPPPPPQQQQQMNDPLAASNSFHSTSSMGGSNVSQYQQQRQSGHSSMPPPPGAGIPAQQSGQYPSSAPYHQNGQIPNGQSGSVQPLYRQQSQPISEPHMRPPSTTLLDDTSTSSFGQTQSSQPPALSMQQPQAQQQQQQPQVSNPSSSASGSGRHDSEWQKVRHKQQRLLLLRHASRCQHKAGECPVTPHCASMKKLWEHIAHCKNQQCSVQHCLSSRYVLSHYRRCKDANCPACGPVRDTIRKSHEKEKSRAQSSRPAPERFDQSMNGSFMSTGSGGSTPPEAYQPERKKAKTEHVQSESPLQVAPALSVSPTTQIVPQQLQSAPPLSASIEAPQVAQVDGPVRLDAMAPLSEQPTSAPITDTGAPAAIASEPSAAVVKSETVQPVPVVETSGKTLDKGTPADYSLLNSFTLKELETHLTSLDRKTHLPPAKLKSKCMEVLKGLQTHNHGWVFNSPVDPVELGLPDYFDIIKKPMDLGTIQKKLENGVYHSIESFRADVDLTFDNAMTYNEDGSVVYDMAKELKIKFEADMKKLLNQLETEDKQRRQNERACTLCGCEKLLFEPPVYFCNGMNCQNQRIRRNSHFYIGGNNQYFWCSTCFNELDEKTPIELADMTITKADLKKKKNDEVHEESWVQCDTCERWVHQVCGLFNTRQNKEHNSEYCCPRCLYEKQKKGEAAAAPRPPGAAALPRTMLSEWLEKHICKRVEARKRQLAEDKAQAEVRRERLCNL